MMGALPNGPSAAQSPPRLSVREPLSSAPQILHLSSLRALLPGCRAAGLDYRRSPPEKGIPGSCTDLCPYGSLPPAFPSISSKLAGRPLLRYKPIPSTTQPTALQSPPPL